MLFDPRPKKRRDELYDRNEEIENLKELVEKYPFTVMLGIRRVGKSSVLRVALSEMKNAVYIDVRKLHFESGGWITSSVLLKEMEKSIDSLQPKIKRLLIKSLRNIKEISVGGVKINLDKNLSLGDVFEALNENGKFVIAFDEAQYFKFYGKRGGKELLSLISYAYDNLTNLSFIFTGSEIGLLYDFLGMEHYSSPLYGRVYGELSIEPFSKDQSLDFLKKGFEELDIKVDDKKLEYAVKSLDGIPGWLVEFGYSYYLTRDFEKSIEKVKDKAERFIEGEIKELDKRSLRYRMILKAISIGLNRWGKIKEYIEFKSGHIPNSRLASLLRTLEKLSWIKFENGRYKIIDPVVENVIKERL